MSTNDESIELTDTDCTVVSTDFSPEREKELEGQGIILNYRIVSSPIDPRSDNDKRLAHYQTGRAKHYVDNLLVPMIRHSVRNPFDVIGSSAMQYTLSAVRGSMAADSSQAN